MVYRVLADCVLVLHCGFILLAVAGGFAVLRWPWFAWIHIPVFVWAALVNLMGWICPLTPLENSFRLAAGESGYSGGFIEHYVGLVVYPPFMGGWVTLFAGISVAVWNLVVYALIYLSRRRR